MTALRNSLIIALLAFPFIPTLGAAAETEGAADPGLFRPIDVFQVEWASDPQISPDGTRVAYVRTSMDIMTDRPRSNIWTINFDGSDHRPITSGNSRDASPRWSPDGRRLLYTSSVNGSTQLYARWMDSGQTAQLTNLTTSPSGIAWSPDGRWIALSMQVPAEATPLAKLPAKPKGAEWAPPGRRGRERRSRLHRRGRHRVHSIRCRSVCGDRAWRHRPRPGDGPEQRDELRGV